MENKITLNYLQNKVWYRAMKVFYFLIIFIAFIFFNSIMWIAGNTTENQPDFSTLRPVGNSITQSSEPLTQLQMKNMSSEYNKIYSSSSSTSTIAQWNEFDKAMAQSQNASQPSNLKSTIYYILGNLVILLFFEVIRRAFYYVVLGSIKPKK